MNKKTFFLLTAILGVAVAVMLLGVPRWGEQSAAERGRALGSAGANEGRSTEAGPSSSGSSTGSSSGSSGGATGSSTGSGTQVEVVEVAVGPLRDVLVVTGELRADEEVDLRSSVSGIIEDIHFVEGSRVAAGKLLVKIRDRELQAQLEQARLRRDLAVTREGRARTLLAEDSISQETYDEAASNLRVLEAEISLIEARIDQTELRAPFPGVVGLRSVSEGSYVSPSVSIAHLQSLDPIKLDFAVPERHAGRVDVGDTMRFTVDGLDGSFDGRVYAVEPRIDPETRTLRLRARARNPNGRLKPGAFARIDLVLETVPDALTVPSLALVPGLTETVVFVDNGGIAQQRTVRTGMRTAAAIEVVSGLEAGELVIVSGLQQVRDGEAVVSKRVDPSTLVLPPQDGASGSVTVASGGRP